MLDAAYRLLRKTSTSACVAFVVPVPASLMIKVRCCADIFSSRRDQAEPVPWKTMEPCVPGLLSSAITRMLTADAWGAVALA